MHARHVRLQHYLVLPVVVAAQFTQADDDLKGAFAAVQA
jgi:hypothetical protein